jgi:hypothetical protein
MKFLCRSSAAVLFSFALSLPVFSQQLVEYALILTMVCNNCDTGNGTFSDRVTLETCATKISSEAIKVGFIYQPAQPSPDNSVGNFEIAFEGPERGTTFCKYYTPPDGPGHLAMVVRGPPGLAGDMNGDGIDDFGLFVPTRNAKNIGVAVQVSIVNPNGTRTVIPVDRVFYRYNYFSN